MGEKDIVEEGVIQQPQVTGKGGPGSTTGKGTGPGGPGGGDLMTGPTDGQLVGGGSPGTSGGGSGPSEGDRVNDCADIQVQMEELRAAMEELRSQNDKAAGQAVDSFYSNNGYKDMQKLLVAESVIDSNNAVGKKLIDYALKAVGGIEGAAKAGGMSEGMVAGVGKTGGAILKELGTSADELKDKALDELGKAMKEGAMANANADAKKKFTDFYDKAWDANMAAEKAKAIKGKLDELAKKAKDLNCPGDISVPNPIFKRIDTAPFMQGSRQGEAGPSYGWQTADGKMVAGHPPKDMFQAGSKGML